MELKNVQVTCSTDPTARKIEFSMPYLNLVSSPCSEKSLEDSENDENKLFAMSLNDSCTEVVEGTESYWQDITIKTQGSIKGVEFRIFHHLRANCFMDNRHLNFDNLTDQMDWASDKIFNWDYVLKFEYKHDFLVKIN